jgi:hypothetical protein
MRVHMGRPLQTILGDKRVSCSLNHRQVDPPDAFSPKFALGGIFPSYVRLLFCGFFEPTLDFNFIASALITRYLTMLRMDWKSECQIR